MTIRTAVFWVHLSLGLLVGAVVAVMSLTGIAIAFEEEILAWRDRHVARVDPPQRGQTPLNVAELRTLIEREAPRFAADQLIFPRDPRQAYQVFAGRAGPLYVNPYSGAVRESEADGWHDALHFLTDVHRWLGLSGQGQAVGRIITGVSNLVLLLIVVTGLYLWMPKRWSLRALKPRLLLRWRVAARARDFLWHHVLGFWSFPVLLVLVATGVVISFGWAHDLVFRIAGETPPQFRDFRMTLMPSLQVPAPPTGSARLSAEDLLARTRQAFPEWESIRFPLADPSAEDATAPVKLTVTMPDYMPNRANIPVEMDPYTGKILRAIHLRDRSPAMQARIWIRFLHTGAAFGLPGKIIATLATAAALLLVYTGYALSYRRFTRVRVGRPQHGTERSRDIGRNGPAKA